MFKCIIKLKILLLFFIAIQKLHHIFLKWSLFILFILPILKHVFHS